jgi:hypothetical protein
MDNRSQHQSSGALWTLWILSVPLVYVLSVGPVVRLTMDNSHARGVPEWVDALYRPLGWIHEHTPLEKPLEWYMELWLKGATPP